MAHCVFCCGNLWCRLATGRTGGQNEPQRLVSAYFLLALVCHLCVKTFERKKETEKTQFQALYNFFLPLPCSQQSLALDTFQKSRFKWRKISWFGPCFQKNVRFCYKKNLRKSLILSDALKEMEYLFYKLCVILGFSFCRYNENAITSNFMALED